MTVSLTAPGVVSGNNFQKWQRDGADLTTNASTTVVMDGNHTMTAVYVTPTTRTLTIASANPGSGVSITASPNDNSNQGGGTSQFTRTYNNNTAVNLTAPATAGGNNFQKWQRDGADFATDGINFGDDGRRSHDDRCLYCAGGSADNGPNKSRRTKFYC